MTETATLELPSDLLEKVDFVAAGLGMPRASAVEEALARWVDREEWRHEQTLLAMAEADAGHVVPHEAVQAWVDSLSTDNPLPPPRYV